MRVSKGREVLPPLRLPFTCLCRLVSPSNRRFRPLEWTGAPQGLSSLPPLGGMWKTRQRREVCMANKPTNPRVLTFAAVHTVCKTLPPWVVAPLLLIAEMFHQLYRNDIAGWCDSPGALATWNIFRRGFADEEDHAPDVILDHSRFAAGNSSADFE